MIFIRNMKFKRALSGKEKVYALRGPLWKENFNFHYRYGTDYEKLLTFIRFNEDLTLKFFWTLQYFLK